MHVAVESLPFLFGDHIKPQDHPYLSPNLSRIPIDLKNTSRRDLSVIFLGFSVISAVEGSGGGMEMDHQHLDSGSSAARRCAACKYLRRRCAPDCVLAPYFPASQPRRYADVHAVFGTSNVTRVLQSLPVQERGRAADTMATEAQWRVQDPVYGCTGIIHRLQQEIRDVQQQLATTRAQLAMHVVHGGGTVPPPLPQQQQLPLAAAAAAAADATAAVTANSGRRHRVDNVHEHEDDDEEVPLMDPDEFLDLDGRL